jgi:hypothetical protein
MHDEIKDEESNAQMAETYARINAATPDEASATERRRIKLEAVHEIVANNELCEGIGAAWRLFLRLLLLENGVICNKSQLIAEKMGTNEKTLRNWIGTLVESKVAFKVNHGKSIEVKLCEPYLGYALLPDALPQPAVVAAEPQDPPKLALLKTIQLASDAAGAKVQISITMP